MLQNTIAIPPATIVKVAETISNVQFPFPLMPRNPVMRFIAGQMMSVTSTGTPPGEALNAASFYLLILLFIASLIKKNQASKTRVI